MNNLYDDTKHPLAWIFYGEGSVKHADVDETFDSVLISAHIAITPFPGRMQMYTVPGMSGVATDAQTSISALVARRIVNYARRSCYESLEEHTAGVSTRDFPRLVGSLEPDQMRYYCARGMRAAIAPKTGPWGVMCKGCPHELECMMNAPELPV